MPVRRDRTVGREATVSAAALLKGPSRDSPTLQAFHSLRFVAAEAVLKQMAAAASAEPGDTPSWDSCREELWALLDFLEPSIEFGLVQPMADYLEWTRKRSFAGAMPAARLASALQALADFFLQTMDPPYGAEIADLLGSVRAVFVGSLPHRHDLPDSIESSWQEAGEFCAALVDGRQDDAMAMMQRRLGADHGLVEFGLNVMQPAMKEIGRRWLEEGLTVAVEHQASSIARTVMAAGLARSVTCRPNGRSVLLACVEGNTHDLGLHLVGDGYRIAGWQVHCLGADVPTGDLVEYATRLRPDVLGLSVAFSHQLWRVGAVVRGVSASTVGHMPLVMAGGGAAMRHERLVRTLGADAVAVDASDAVALSTRMLQ